MSHDIRQYKPTGAETMHLIMPSDHGELAAAESYVDQQYALEDYRDKLSIDYDEHITSGTYFLVDGVQVPSEEPKPDIVRSVFYGRIEEFKTNLDIAGQCWLSALIVNDLTEERNHVFVSSREGYESAFMAVVNEDSRLDTSEWDEVAQHFGHNNVVGFLRKTVAKLAFKRVDLNTEERLQALEQVLDKKFGIAINDHVVAAGRHAHCGTGSPVMLSSLASEDSYPGIYRGITLLGVESSSGNRSQENWPCIVIEQPAKQNDSAAKSIIVQQPLHALRKLERATA